MPAKKVVSERQMEILLQYMEENKGFAVGRHSNSGPLAKLEDKKRWEELATTLNCTGAGATRTSAKWRDYWNEKKYGVRRKVTELKEHGRGTGGGPAKKLSLTPQEDRIFAILGKVAVSGNTSVQVPLHYTQPASAPPSEPMPEPASAPSSEPMPEAFNEQDSESTLATATSPTGVPIATSPLPPPQLAPTPRRSYTPHAAEVPQWAMRIEERHLENEERIWRALDALAATIAAIQRSVAHIEEMMMDKTD